MLHSEKIGNLAAALLLAQGNMGDIIKTATNPHFSSKYAALPSVVECIVPALQSQGIAVLQGGSTSLETMLIHSPSGEWISSIFELQLPADPQKACAANTYARRYALLAIVCAAAEDDDGNKAAAPARAQQPVPAAQKSKADGLTARAKALGIIDLKVWAATNAVEYRREPLLIAIAKEEVKRLSTAAEWSQKDLKAWAEWKMSKAQHGMLFALHTKAGHDDLTRLTFYRSICDRADISSSTELTHPEFDAVIKSLERITSDEYDPNA